VRFELSKLGGVAGRARPPLVVDTDTVDAARASELIALAHRARVFALPQSLGHADAPDQIGYELCVRDGDRQARVEFASKDADAALTELIRALRQVGAG